jgi:Outer membrane protein Omp28
MEVMVELEDPIIPESDRVVFIEELTGASCPNCPKGASALENILAKFPGKAIVLGIHGSFLSQPTSKSKFDFRNQKAKDLENWHKPWFAKPSAAINRLSPDPNDPDVDIMISSPDQWQSEVEKQLAREHVMKILLDSKYDESSRKINLEVAAIPLKDLSGTYKISVFLSESGIIDAQSNGGVVEENYTFKHVLMDMMTPHDGEIFGIDLVGEKIYKKSYEYIIPIKEGLFDPKRMDIIVIVSKDEAKSREVMQAAEIHVVK